MTRTSNNQYGPAGGLLNGFDYDLQVWVKGGIVQPCGHPPADRACCNARRYAGKKLSEAFIHEAARRNPVQLNVAAPATQELFTFDNAAGDRVTVSIEPIRDDTIIHLEVTTNGERQVQKVSWGESDLAQALLALWDGSVTKAQPPDMLAVGDVVFCKGGFGLDPERLTRVTAIEVLDSAEANEGTAVEELPWPEVTARVRVELEDGPWAYGTQITQPSRVLGECPACCEINRHAPRCPRAARRRA